MIKRFKMRPLTVGIMLVTGSVTVYAVEGSGPYITPSAGYYIFDHDNNNRVDDAFYYGIDVGFQFNKNFAIQVGYSWLDDPEVNTDYVKDGFSTPLSDMDGLPRWTGNTVDAQLYRLEGILNLDTGSPVIPYVALGYTHLEQDPRFPNKDDGSEDKDDMVSAGGGIKYMVTPNIVVGGDVRALHSWDNDDTDYTAGLSAGLVFANAPAATPTETPVEEPGDSDGDGVKDDVDRCPDTPAGAQVDTNGCPLDSDGDGVPDHLDKCPGTPPGARVDMDGCPEKLKETITRRLDIKFDTAKAFVKPEYFSQIEAVAQIMREYISTTVTIEGHTDSDGGNSYNQKLSQQRADAVRQVLISQYGVDPGRLVAIGYGETRPIADNKTSAGKQENRRVVAVVNATVEKLDAPAQ